MSERDLSAEVQWHAGRAMTRLNKLRVGQNVRQQQLLTEARDYFSDLLELVQASEDRLDDTPGRVGVFGVRERDMRLAYADPPYPGQSRRHYGQHKDFAGEVDHAELVERLKGYDGWALSTSNRALTDVLALTGPARVLAWCKLIAPPMSGHGVFGWEPVIISWARPPASDLRDTLTASPEQYKFRPRPQGYVTGAKPPAFSRWLFSWLGARPGDQFADLFPGSRVVTDAWLVFDQQTSLEVA